MTKFKNWLTLSSHTILCGLVTVACNQKTPVNPIKIKTQENQGVLRLEANGEDFVRKGFVTKDGWKLNFNHVYVTLTDVIAYQTNPPFDAEKETKLSSITNINLVEKPTTIDLAEGDENAKPIFVSEMKAIAGIYNALAWKIATNNSENPSLILEGIATKNSQKINFMLSFNENLNYLCGEYVGEKRKGIVTNETSGTLEITFHFDHVFGDKKTPPDDTLNQDALGFQSLANLAVNGDLKLNTSMLEEKLSPQDYNKLQKTLKSLGHVGEGHCQEIES